jgi:CheY-like chemotaxis protein
VSAPPCTGIVVVVDDEEDTRELLRTLLELHGYQVATAEDGEAALSVIANTPRVCLVILDFLMPRMGGLEVLKRLGADGTGRSPPVWISTSAPEQAPANVPCLPKPVDVDRLISLVAAHCGGDAGA